MTVPIPRARPQRPGEQRSTQVPLVEGESARLVVMPSLHNWVEQVYKAFNQTFPTGANEIALLGVREMSRTAGATPAADTEDSYTQNERPADRGAPTAQTKGGDATTTFNDLLFMVWTGSTPEEGTSARVYACTIDPSIDLSATAGSPYLLEGKVYKTANGPHNNIRQALHVFNARRSESDEDVMLAREATKRARVFTEVKSALVPPKSNDRTRRWEFVALNRNNTIHVHWGFSYATTAAAQQAKNFSAGCTVIMLGRDHAAYKEFVSLTKDAANSSEIPYLVVSSAYVQSPDVWATSAAEDQTKLQEASHTLRANGLVRAPAPLTGYLPSIMTFEFAQQVLRLADDVDKLTAAASGGDVSGLDEALANVLFLERDELLPRSLPPRLSRWSAARSAGRPLPEEDRAGLLDGLSGLSEALRSSLERACFTTVLPD